MLAKEKKVRNTESRSEPVIVEVTVVIFKKTVIEFFCVKEIKRFSLFKSDISWFDQSFIKSCIFYRYKYVINIDIHYLKTSVNKFNFISINEKQENISCFANF